MLIHGKTPAQLLVENKPMTVGLLGNKGCGKDTVANVLVDVYGFYKTSFAKALYIEVAEAFGVTVEFLSNRGTKEECMSELILDRCTNKDFWRVAYLVTEEERRTCTGSGWFTMPTTRQLVLSPRKALQLWGTEYRRAEDNYYWIKKAAAETEGIERVVFSDVREHHEASYIKRRDNGIVIGMNRPNNPYYIPEGRGTSGHSSESQVASIARDVDLINDQTLDVLAARTLQIMETV